MTNPNNAVGTNGAFGGRTSVNAFNDVMAAFQGRGILSGWAISPDSGMTVAIGGSGITRDSAIAEDNAGNKTSVNNISNSPISVTLDSAPASNSRYDAIVAYVDKPPTSPATQDNPECCGIISVTGIAASTPTYPDDTDIRDAITADGASGSTAYYVVLGYITIENGTTDITADMITAGNYATIGTNQIADGAVTSDKIDWATSTAMDFTSSVTFGEGTPTQYTEFLVKQNTVWIDYQGYNKPHSINETLFTLPEAYRPSVRKQVSGSFGGVNPALFIINTDGTCVINQATPSGLSGTLRAYLQVSYPLP